MNADKGFRTIAESRASFKTNAISIDTMNADNALRSAAPGVRAYVDDARRNAGQYGVAVASAERERCVLHARPECGGFAITIECKDEATVLIRRMGTVWWRIIDVRRTTPAELEQKVREGLELDDVTAGVGSISSHIEIGPHKVAEFTSLTYAHFNGIIDWFMGDALGQSTRRISAPLAKWETQHTLAIAGGTSFGWIRDLKQWGFVKDGVLLWACSRPDLLAGVPGQLFPATLALDVLLPGFTVRLNHAQTYGLMCNYDRDRDLVKAILSDYEAYGGLRWDNTEFVNTWRAAGIRTGWPVGAVAAHNPQLYYQTMIETAHALASRHRGGVTLRIWRKDNPTVRLEISRSHGLLAKWSVRSIRPAPGRIVIGHTSSIERVAKWCTKVFTAAWMHLPPAQIPRGNECVIQIV